MNDFRSDQRFQDLVPFKEKIWLSSPTMHGVELEYMTEAYRTNWMSTVGGNIDEMERLLADYIGVTVRWDCPAVRLHYTWQSGLQEKNYMVPGMLRWGR